MIYSMIIKDTHRMADPITLIETDTNMATLKISYGFYGWCCNNYGGEKSGYYLSKDTGVCDKCSSYPEKKIRVVIEFNIPNDVLENINFIQIYDSTGFLVNYNTTKITSTYKCSFKVDESLCGTMLKICYDKYVPHKKNYYSLYRISNDTSNHY